MLRGITGASTVPRVFVGGKSVGGCDETMRAERTGQLRGLLEQAGAV